MNKETELVYFAHPPGWATFDLAALDDRARVSSGWTSLVSPVDGSILEVGTDVLQDGVTIQVGRSSHVRDELLAHFRARAMEVGAALVVAAVLGGLLIAYVALAPVRSLEVTTQAILETRRFDARVLTRGTRDPLDQLGARINEMLGQIQTLLAGMRGALDNVAHDLRTPLTRFRNVAEQALIEADPAKARDGLAQALEEADRVSATLTALIDVSEAEAGTMRLSVERLRAAPIAEEAISLYADEAEERGIVVESAINPALEVSADRTRLRQVLANLIENAVKYHRARRAGNGCGTRRRRNRHHGQRHGSRHRSTRSSPRVGPAVPGRREPIGARAWSRAVARQGHRGGPWRARLGSFVGRTRQHLLDRVAPGSTAGSHA